MKKTEAVGRKILSAVAMGGSTLKPCGDRHRSHGVDGYTPTGSLAATSLGSSPPTDKCIAPPILRECKAYSSARTPTAFRMSPRPIPRCSGGRMSAAVRGWCSRWRRITFACWARHRPVSGSGGECAPGWEQCRVGGGRGRGLHGRM